VSWIFIVLVHWNDILLHSYSSMGSLEPYWFSRSKAKATVKFLPHNILVNTRINILQWMLTKLGIYLVILECSQGLWRTDGSVTISPRNFVGEGIKSYSLEILYGSKYIACELLYIKSIWIYNLIKSSSLLLLNKKKTISKHLTLWVSKNLRKSANELGVQKYT
jgi:hypothetical protein